MGSSELFVPSTERELSDFLRSHALETRPVVTGTDNPGTDALQTGDDQAAGLTIVSTSRMSEVVSFRPRDLTIEVGAGLRMRRLRAIVEDEGLWVPAAGIGADRSIGGWIAAATPAIWDASHGPVRRQLLGCRVTAANGTDLSWGRAVMKNVAGYDLPRLMAGSRGRLGVLTRVTIRLWPHPEAVTAWEIRGDVEPFVRSSAEADAITWTWTRRSGERITAMFTGSADSVRRRAGSLAARARASGAEIGEAEARLEPGVGRGERLPGSVVYLLRPGRRYLPQVFRELVARNDARLGAIEAIPEAGTILVFLDPDNAGTESADEFLSHVAGSAARSDGAGVREPEIGVERGGPAEHQAAGVLRAPGTRMVERRIEQALDAWPRAWQADYL